MIRINLLPYRQERRLKRVNLIFAAWGVAAVIGVIIAFGVDFYVVGLSEEQAAIKSGNEAKIAEQEKKLGELGTLKELQQEILKRLEVVKTLGASRMLTLHVLDEISQVMTDRVWLNSFSTVGGRLILAGVAASNDDVANLMRSIEKTCYFNAVQLTRVTEIKEAGRDLKQFEVSAAIVNPAAGPAPEPKGAKKEKK